MNCKWTPEREERLRELFAKGLSAAQIAAKMGGFEGFTEGGRLAVCCKLSRMGLIVSEVRADRPDAYRAIPYRPGIDPKPEHLRLRFSNEEAA